MANVYYSKPEIQEVRQYFPVQLWIHFNAKPDVKEWDHPGNFEAFIEWDDYARIKPADKCIEIVKGLKKPVLVAVTQQHRYMTPGPKYVGIHIHNKKAKKPLVEMSGIWRPNVLPVQDFKPPDFSIPTGNNPISDFINKIKLPTLKY